MDVGCRTMVYMYTSVHLKIRNARGEVKYINKSAPTMSFVVEYREVYGYQVELNASITLL